MVRTLDTLPIEQFINVGFILRHDTADRPYLWHNSAQVTIYGNEPQWLLDEKCDVVKIYNEVAS